MQDLMRFPETPHVKREYTLGMTPINHRAVKAHILTLTHNYVQFIDKIANPPMDTFLFEKVGYKERLRYKENIATAL